MNRAWDFEYQMKILEALIVRTQGHNELMLKVIMGGRSIHDKPLSRNLNELESKGLVRVRKEGWKRGKKKPIEITDKGRQHYLQNQEISKLREFSARLFEKISPEEKLDVLSEILLSGFKIYFKTFYEKGNVEDYAKFVSSIEEPIRDFLNEDNFTEEMIAQIKNGVDISKGFMDPYFLIDDLPLLELYQDALKAREEGHFLTQNHRYILHKLEGYKNEELEQHNVEWSQRFQKQVFTGKESEQSLSDYIHPTRIVLNEYRCRGEILKKDYLHRKNVYDHNPKWKIDVESLKARWIEAQKLRGRYLEFSQKRE